MRASDGSRPAARPRAPSQRGAATSACHPTVARVSRWRIGRRTSEARGVDGLLGGGRDGGYVPVRVNPAESIASSLFAASLLPYLGFLYHLTKSATAPRLTLFGFYFLLAFVGATSKPYPPPAKLVYNTSLSNVDYLHGSAESLLTITNLLIVLGLRQGLREAADGSPAEEKGETRATAEMTSRSEESSIPLSKEDLLFLALGPPQLGQQTAPKKNQCDDADKPLFLPFSDFCTLSVYGSGCKQADLLGSLSKDKKHGVDDIALPAPIWSHDRGEALKGKP
eukprot:SM000078S22085  [mRNA]  locus=s78:339187:349053:+ [translate_table: standard]